MDFLKTITKEEISTLPLYKHTNEIILINNETQITSAIQDLNSKKELGFDTETRPAFKKGESYDVALLQLSTGEKTYLFRLNQIGLPEGLTAILADKNIVKTGVAIRDDIIGLKKLRPFTEQAFVELATMAKERNIEKYGLRALVAITTGKRLSKKAKITNWEKPELTSAQIEYAACDAKASLDVYQKLK